MPYIKVYDRSLIDAQAKFPENAGELNYAFTDLCKLYIMHHGESYQHYNDILGALEGCKLELYRRKISVYEDLKITENTDVY